MKMTRRTTKNIKSPKPGTTGFYYTVCTLLQEKGTAKGVAHALSMTPQALSYHLKKLKVLDVIEYIGHGTWHVHEHRLNLIPQMPRKPTKVVKKIKSRRSDNTGGVGAKTFLESQQGDNKREVGGHGYLWRLKLPSLARWRKKPRRLYLEKKGIDHTPIPQGERLEPTKEEPDRWLAWTVWLTNKSVVAWAPKGKRWIADDEASAAAYAFYDFMRIVKKIESLVNVRLTINGEYMARPRREHNAHLKSKLPDAIKRRGELFAVWDDTGTWLKIDESTGEPELETEASGSLGRVKEIRDASKLVRDDYNLLKDEGVTRQFLLEQDARIQEKLLKYAQNIEEHVRVMRKIGDYLEKIEEREKNA